MYQDNPMATKTISIDVEAYERLKSVQKPEESFSQVIKRVIRPPIDVGAWLDLLRRHPISKAAGDAIEEQVRRRRQPAKRAR
jgi:predicted CopG family antitoxin